MNSEASFGEIPRSQENRIDFYSCKQFSIDFLYEIMHFNSKKKLVDKRKKIKETYALLHILHMYFGRNPLCDLICVLKLLAARNDR